MFARSPFISTIFKRSIGAVRTTTTGTGTTSIPKQYQLFNFNNFITNFKSSSSRSSYGGSSNYSNYSSSNNSNNTLKLLFASAGSSFLLLFTFARKIHNDTGSLTQYQQQQQQQPSIDLSISKQQPLQKQYHESRFSNYLNYEELTIGSVVGLFSGVIIGKLSQVIVFVSLSSYFLIEFLENKNIIHIPWNYFITIGKEKINLKQLFFEKPSFKISFVLSFIIAAYNV
ncbi:Protein not essential for viability [Candida albicans P76055]|nr:Protein not essential for viability [Candida albicans P76055]